MKPWFAGLKDRWTAYNDDQRGTAAVEFALVVGFLVMILINITDLAIYAYQSIQVATAAQVGAHAGWTACNSSNLWPATANCPKLDSVVLGGVQSTSLGTSITESSLPSEGYFCVTTDQTLVAVSTLVTTGSPSGSPSTCSGATPPSGKTWSNGSAAPGEYLTVNAQYSYAPIFAAASVASLLPSTISKSTWARVK